MRIIQMNLIKEPFPSGLKGQEIEKSESGSTRGFYVFDEEGGHGAGRRLGAEMMCQSRELCPTESLQETGTSFPAATGPESAYTKHELESGFSLGAFR